MELLKQEQIKVKNEFLKACEKFIKEHPSKNITGECKNCFLFYIQSDLRNFKAFTKNNYNYNYTDCYRIASFLQDTGLIKIKSGTVDSKIDEDKTTYIDCDKFSFLNSFGKNKI